MKKGQGVKQNKETTYPGCLPDVFNHVWFDVSFLRTSSCLKISSSCDKNMGLFSYPKTPMFLYWAMYPGGAGEGENIAPLVTTTPTHRLQSKLQVQERIENFSSLVVWIVPWKAVDGARNPLGIWGWKNDVSLFRTSIAASWVFLGLVSAFNSQGCIEKTKDDSAGKIKCVFLHKQNHTYKIMRIVAIVLVDLIYMFVFFPNDSPSILMDVVVEP